MLLVDRQVAAPSFVFAADVGSPKRRLEAGRPWQPGEIECTPAVRDRIGAEILVANLKKPIRGQLSSTSLNGVNQYLPLNRRKSDE